MSMLINSKKSIPESPKELIDGMLFPSTPENNTSGKTHQHIFTTLPSSNPPVLMLNPSEISRVLIAS